MEQPSWYTTEDEFMDLVTEGLKGRRDFGSSYNNTMHPFDVACNVIAFIEAFAASVEVIGRAADKAAKEGDDV